MPVQYKPHSPLHFNARISAQGASKPVHFGGPVTELLMTQNAGETIDQVGDFFKLVKYSFMGLMGSLGVGIGYFLTGHQMLLKSKMNHVVAEYKQQAETATAEEHRQLFEGLMNHKNHHVRCYAADNVMNLPDNVADRNQKIAWLQELAQQDAGMAKPKAKETLRKLGVPDREYR